MNLKKMRLQNQVYTGEKTMKKQMLIKHMLIMILIASAYTTSTLTEEKPSPENSSTSKPNFDETTYNWSRTFAEVLQLTNQKHYKPDNVEDSMMKSIDAFLNNLDPHSAFLGPKTYQRMMEATSGEFFW